MKRWGSVDWPLLLKILGIPVGLLAIGLALSLRYNDAIFFFLFTGIGTAGLVVFGVGRLFKKYDVTLGVPLRVGTWYCTACGRKGETRITVRGKRYNRDNGRPEYGLKVVSRCPVWPHKLFSIMAATGRITDGGVRWYYQMRSGKEVVAGMLERTTTEREERSG